MTRVTSRTTVFSFFFFSVLCCAHFFAASRLAAAAFASFSFRSASAFTSYSFRRTSTRSAGRTVIRVSPSTLESVANSTAKEESANDNRF